MKIATRSISTAIATASIIACSISASADPVKLDYRDLFNGHKAYKVAVNEADKSIQLDDRVFKYGKEREGVIVTDPVNVGPSQAGIDLPVTVSRLDIAVDADLPSPASVSVWFRSGPHRYDFARWSDWKQLDGLSSTVEEIDGRFVQLKLTVASDKRDALPAVSGVNLKPAYADEPRNLQSVGVVKSDIEKIVTSPIDFKHERPDNPDLVNFAREANLEEVVSSQSTDFDKLVALMDWTASCHNGRKTGREKHEGCYAWDIDRVFEMRKVKKNGKTVKQPTIYGHCMSYAEVMVSAANALGFKARHLVMLGFREASHEIVEAWVPSLGKWVYFDPSLSNYYYDKETKQPLNLIEMHNVVKNNFLPEGKTMRWFIPHKSQETRDYVKKIGGQKPIGSRLGPWIYGDPMPEDYDWGWYHGYLAAGFVQMTPRNDFESNPEANPRQFGKYPPYGGYPFWVDEKTPPRGKANNWYTRMRDFYWTVDQASFRLLASDKTEEVLLVELGNSMPFFREYRIAANGRTGTQKGSVFAWKLKPGINELTVWPVNEMGRTGTPSSVRVALHK